MNLDPTLHLVISGYDVVGWVSQLSKLAQKLNISERITWTGPLNGDMKWAAIQSADCCVLPSHSENFSVVVVEALMCSVPVIITNKVKIWKEVDKSRAGIISSDNEYEYSQSLAHWLSLDEKNKMEMAVNARQCFSTYFNIDHNALDFLKMLKTILNKAI